MFKINSKKYKKIIQHSILLNENYYKFLRNSKHQNRLRVYMQKKGKKLVYYFILPYNLQKLFQAIKQVNRFNV